jgi:serine/threonine-protein kinase
VGALAYYLLTAQYVFNSDSVVALYEKHLTEPPVPPGQRTVNLVSAEMEETILRCLEKEPNLRPQSVGELRAMLLTSPRAAEWTMEARAAWWARYYSQAAETAAETIPPAPSPLDATIRIDIATRMK